MACYKNNQTLKNVDKTSSALKMIDSTTLKFDLTDRVRLEKS